MKRLGHGFGLIEVMVAMAIGLVVVLGTTQIFIASRNTYVVQNTAARMQEDARFALSKIMQEVRVVGMYGCLSKSGFTDSAYPYRTDFATPITWDSANNVLTLITADVGSTGSTPTWTVVSDCRTLSRAYDGAPSSVASGYTAYPLRQVTYTVENGQLKIGATKAVLVDNVKAFNVSFGLGADNSVSSYSSAPSDPSTIVSVRLTLTLTDPNAKVQDQTYNVVASLRNRLF